MTLTRRALLQAAGVVAGGAALGECSAAREPARPGGVRVFLTTEDGVTVLDRDGRAVSGPTRVAASTPDWRHAVTTSRNGSGTRIAVRDLASGRVLSEDTLDDRLEPRTVSTDGALIASVTPGGAGIYGLHDPRGRQRTTVVVSRPTAERVRLDLPGNIEPEAFSPDGEALFVLDYTPADKPQRYRVAVVDLATRRMAPVPGETMNAHRIVRVHDTRRATLFTVCSREEDDVAFVHCVHLRERRTRRIALPAPFGRGRPGVHGIALSPSGDRLVVVHSLSGSIADIDPDRMALARVGSFAKPGEDGKPGVLITPSGQVVVALDGKVIATGPRREIATPGEVRGLALGTDGDIWVGHPDGLVHHDLATGRRIGRIAVPGMYVLQHVR